MFELSKYWLAHIIYSIENHFKYNFMTVLFNFPFMYFTLAHAYKLLKILKRTLTIL